LGPDRKQFGTPLLDLYNLTARIGTYAGNRRPFLEHQLPIRTPHWAALQKRPSPLMRRRHKGCRTRSPRRLRAASGEIAFNHFDLLPTPLPLMDRAIAIDANSIPTGTDLVNVHHNYFKARNNRAFRCRCRHCSCETTSSKGMVSDKDGYGTIHWADQQQNYCSPNQSYGLSGGIPNAEYNIWTNPASGRAHYLWQDKM
jgi:hypothetical protein